MQRSEKGNWERERGGEEAWVSCICMRIEFLVCVADAKYFSAIFSQNVHSVSCKKLTVILPLCIRAFIEFWKEFSSERKFRGY